MGRCRRDRQEIRKPAPRGEICFRRTDKNTDHFRNSNGDSPDPKPTEQSRGAQIPVARSPKFCTVAQSKGAQIPVASATEFCTVALDISELSVRNLVSRHTSAPRILRWLLDFLFPKICESLA